MTEFVFPHDVPPPPVGATPIFRLKPAEVSEPAVQAIAERFDLGRNAKSGIWRRDTIAISYREGPWELSVFHESGGWRYRDTTRWQVDDGVSNLAIADAAAIEIAETHVERLGLARRDERVVLEVTRLHVGVAEKATGYAEERIIDVAVAFQRVIEGVRVEGAGGKIVVYLDAAGAVTGIDRLWREIQDVQAVTRLRDPRTALEDLRKEWGAIGHGRIEVTDLRLSYVEHDWRTAQSHLQPMYVMPLKVRSYNHRFVSGSEHVVPAAVDYVESWRRTPEDTMSPPPPSVAPRPAPKAE